MKRLAMGLAAISTLVGFAFSSCTVDAGTVRATVYNQPTKPLTFGNLQVKTVKGSFKMYSGSQSCTYPEILYKGKVIWDAHTAYYKDPNHLPAPTVPQMSFDVLRDSKNDVFVAASCTCSADGNDDENLMGGVSQSGKVIAQFSRNAIISTIRLVTPDTMQFAYQQVNHNLPAFEWDQGNWVVLTYSLPALKLVSQIKAHSTSSIPWGK